MARMRDQIHQMDIVFVAIPHEFGGSMAAMSIKKKDPGLAISISLREEYLTQPSQAMSLEVHPFSEVVYSESGISPCLNQELCTDFPLKMTRQRVRLPTAEAVSMIETHSRFSGDFLYDLVVEELPTTVWFIHLSHPYSSCQHSRLGVLFGPL